VCPLRGQSLESRLAAQPGVRQARQESPIDDDMSRECLFCGVQGPGVLSKEHVTPKWLLKVLGLPKNDQLFQGVALAKTGHLLEPRRVQSTFGFVEGRVCRDCNGGWMHRLENLAKPLLVPLISKQRDPASLSRSECSVIGKWAAKTAYLHTWAGPLKEPVELPHLRNLRGDLGAPTDGVGVYAMQANYVKPSGYIQTGAWPQLGVSEPASIKGAHKVGLQFRHLYLLIALWPDPTSVLTRIPGVHTRLMPGPEAPDAEYPMAAELGSSPIAILEAFTNGLGVLHHSPAA
jgi:hypothetical protein